jgi:branched-chain amino acid transport system substrate-binding protein
MTRAPLRPLAVCAASLLSIALAGAPALADFPPYAKTMGVALVAPFSGDQRLLGIQLSNGLNLAIDQANERRNLADFVFVYHSFDDQADPGVAQQQADFALVDPLTSVVIGHVGAEETFLSEPIYHQKGAPLIIPTSPIAQLTRAGYDNVFRLCPTDIVEGQQSARYAERTLHAKKAAVVYEQTTYGADAGGGFVDYASSGKALAVKDFAVDPELKNAKAVVAAVVAYAPDLVYLSGDGAAMGNVLSALRAAGVTVQAMGTQAFYDLNAIKTAGPSADSMLVSSCVPPAELMPTANIFMRDYHTRYGQVTSFALMGYVAGQIAIAAAQQSRSTDKQTLIRQLQLGTFPTILGNYSFVRGGDVANPIVYFYQYGYAKPAGQFKYIGSSYPNPLVTR